LPYIAVLNVFAFSSLQRFFARDSHRLVKSGVGVLLFSIVVLSSGINIGLFNKLYAVSSRLSEKSEIVTYIQTHTTSADYLLVWGIEPNINFLAQRNSPTPYVSLSPFTIDGFATPEIVALFTSKLRQNLPAIIVDTGDPALPALGRDDLSPTSPAPLGLVPFMNFIRSHYHRDRMIDGWTIYVLNK
jgi:hypothetical protein